MTLIEIMVVLAIIGLLMGAVGFKLFQQHRRAQIRTTEHDIITIRQAMTSYSVDHAGRCPPSLDELVKDGVIEETPTDAWGAPFQMTCPAEHGTAIADIWSPGPDGKDGTADDICSWKIGGRSRSTHRAVGDN